MFYVKIVKIPNGLFDHQFWYASDLRFNKEMPTVDAAAIFAWCSGLSYHSIYINF